MPAKGLFYKILRAACSVFHSTLFSSPRLLCVLCGKFLRPRIIAAMVLIFASGCGKILNVRIADDANGLTRTSRNQKECAVMPRPEGRVYTRPEESPLKRAPTTISLLQQASWMEIRTRPFRAWPKSDPSPSTKSCQSCARYSCLRTTVSE